MNNPEKMQKILIVDDNKQNIELLMDLFKDKYKISASISAERALKIARSDSPPDIILMDIIMPDMDGYQACAILQKDERTQNIPVIFVTAVSEVMDEARGFELGAVDYITKPFHPPTVKARVDVHLKLKRQQALLEKLVHQLQETVDEVKTLQGFIPICAGCKKIRDDEGYWEQIEKYIQEHSKAQFTHSICPDCAKKYYPEYRVYDD